MKMYSWRMVIKQSIVLTLSATIGVTLYLIINHWVVVALLSMPLMWGLLSIFKMRVPAVYAFPLLAYVFLEMHCLYCRLLHCSFRLAL